MNMMLNLNLRGVVSNQNGRAKTTSYAVAEAFGKLHKNVIRDIEKIRCSEKFRKLNFELCYENNELQNGKPRKFYQMTERGFMFLVMGFNGEKADAIKESFIDAFEWMANQLTQAFQSKWARYNLITNQYNNQKAHVSGCASSMSSWRWEKQPMENEIAQLEQDLQSQLNFLDDK